MGEANGKVGRPTADGLSQRELEVAKLVHQGSSNAEIARALDIQESTAANHVGRILGKLGLHNRVQLAKWVEGRVPGLGRTRELSAEELSVVIAELQRLTGTRDVHDAVRALARPSATRLTNLPAATSSFVGREQELRKVKSLAQNRRLVTLTGTGGVGKTRLAVQVASELRDQFDGGVWLVDLSPLADAGRIGQSVASAMSLQEDPGLCVRSSVNFALSDTRTLIVLDNCEHLLQGCAEFVRQLLINCPRVHILATSQQPLHVPGETVWRVPSLSLPVENGATTPLEDLRMWDAVDLFVDRAVAVDSEFTLSKSNALLILEICRSLDGIPLALELAAARVSDKTVEEIAQKLTDRFEFLIGGSSATPPRQRTLRAAVDWSYALLTPPERKLFDRLSIFPSTFTHQAALAICGADDLTDSIEPDLHALVDKSLVIADRVDGVTRYRLLETLRQYGHERLPPAEENQLLDQHAKYYLWLAQSAQAQLSGAEQARWLRALEAEYLNLRSAQDRSLRAPSPDLAYGFVAALWRFWEQLGHLSDGRKYADEVLATYAEATPELRAAALHRAGVLAWRQGEYEQAKARLKDALGLLDHAADESTVALVRLNLGNVAWERGDLDAAEHEYTASLEIRRGLVASGHLEEQAGVASCLNNLGIVESDRGNFENALVWHRQSLALRREIKHQAGIALSLQNFGEVELRRKNLVEAREYYANSLRMFKDLKERLLIARDVDAFARLAEAEGNLKLAARLFGATARFRELTNTRLERTDKQAYDRSIGNVLAGLGMEESAKALAAGGALSLDEAIDEALGAVPVA